MGSGVGTYGVAYKINTDVASPPGDWIVSLTEFQFTQVNDYDINVVRGSGFVSQKATTTCRIQSPVVSTDGVTEVRIELRRDLRLWDDIP